MSPREIAMICRSWKGWLAIAVIPFLLGIAWEAAALPNHGFPPPVPYPDDNWPTHAGEQLGRRLFYDPMLSGNNSISCASCHQQQFAFADTLQHSIGLEGRKAFRNTMSLSNLLGPICCFGMGGLRHWKNWCFIRSQTASRWGRTSIVWWAELQADSLYPQLFKEAFDIDTIEASYIPKALAQFLRKLNSFGSEIDRRLGMATDLSSDSAVAEIIFEGFSEKSITTILKCIKCHDPKFYGAGLMLKNDGQQPDTNDTGRFRITQEVEDLDMFKAPTLRNIALTAPYMHDGSIATLPEVIEHYNSGIQDHPNLDSLLKKDGKPIRLGLSEKEKAEVLSFLEMLTDPRFLHNPALSSPFE